MSVLPGLIAAGGLVAAGFLVAFAWAVRAGQFDDTASPPIRVLLDHPGPAAPPFSEDSHDASAR